MMRFTKLLGNIFMYIKNVSKRAFTKGLVVISAGMVTILLLGTNGFIVNSKTDFLNLQEDIQEELEEPLPSEELSDGNIQELEKEATLESQEIEEEKAILLKEGEEEIVLKTASQNSSELEEVIIYTEEDYMALVKIIEAEATGEDITGKILVGNVVLNRVKSSNFPNTIYDVIYQESNGRAQFSPVDDGRIDSIPLTQESYDAADRALKGEDHSNGALFFVARSIASDSAVSWFENSLRMVKKHGVHEFYAYN